jgi:hypothetical protein
MGAIVWRWRFWTTGLPRKPMNGVAFMDIQDRADAYLRRIVALTGAMQVGSYYILDVGETRFEVRDSYVCRMRHMTQPTATFGGTCFYSPNRHMPAAEKIAAALLQLKNNPKLFDKWAAQTGVFKADGELFKSSPTD